MPDNRYVVVEGVIGVGKTSLSRLLSERLQARLVLEEVEENPFLTENQARHLTIHGVARNEDGTYTWKFDNYTRGFSPARFTDEELVEMRRRISCPTLLVRGRVSDLLSEEGARELLEIVPHAQYTDVAGAGHMVAGDRNDAFNDAVVNFLDEVRRDGGATR